MAFKIESRRLGGWEDAGWTVDDKPMRFKTIGEAQKEIDETCALHSQENKNNYRVAPVKRKVKQ